MQSLTDHHLRIILKFHSESGNSTDSFWTNLKQFGEEEHKGRPIHISMLANHIRSFFPSTMLRFISTVFPFQDGSSVLEPGSLQAQVTEITEQDDARLEIGLQFQSPEKLAELFAYNFDFFDLFLRSYAPLAFLKSMQIRPAHLISWLGLVEQISTGIVADPAFFEYFHPSEKNVREKSSAYLSYI